MSWDCFGLGRKWLRWCSLVVVFGDFGGALAEVPALSCFRYKITCRDGHRGRETLLHPAGQVALLRLQRLCLWFLLVLVQPLKVFRLWAFSEHFSSKFSKNQKAKTFSRGKKRPKHKDTLHALFSRAVYFPYLQSWTNVIL